MTFKELDTAIPEETETSQGPTPEQEAKAAEFIAQMEESAITVDGKKIYRDSDLISQFLNWCREEKVWPIEEITQRLDHSEKWIWAQREKEAQAGILYSKNLYFYYSKNQLEKILADPENESLYGLACPPRMRKQYIEWTKTAVDYKPKEEETTSHNSGGDSDTVATGDFEPEEW